ncbi:DNA replication regulator SLD3-domain-containing protein [Lophiotrema nucula]|uniref:DNA replication regulator SLD3-domain-containing protein n=1 Tax=Lophiotrema nucula TaxID=690887 RepID=A0A6A5ZQK2_9PLEO|nr:DNA replication regulator SLD3-domain-containing protein [Lophiotrema nucula]
MAAYAYALSTKTMLQTMSEIPAHILGLPPKRDLAPKPQLPSKRKRDSICGLGAFNKPFTIKPCPESPYDKPSTFKPVRIIGRSQLPLTFLDTATDSSFAPSQLFSANIEILEKHHESQIGDTSSAKVLIARHETTKSLYAIERVQSRIFSLCKLAIWLKEKDVGDLWDPAYMHMYPVLPRVEQIEGNGEQWWQLAAVTTAPEERPTKRTRISMLRPKEEPVEAKPPPVSTEQNTPFETKYSTTYMTDISPVLETGGPSPQQQLESLVQQYLDATYLSKTSLAYFAKGPVARIRNAFTSPDEGAPPTYDLVAFLRLMLLSHKAGDKKYNHKLPEMIKAIPPGAFSDDEEADKSAKPKKSKKKIKLSREGVYPHEEEIVKKWWMSELPGAETYGEETIDQRIKRRVGELRVRETLAQMILMLEIVALEALSTYKEPPEEVPAEAKTQNQDEMQETQAQVKTKKRKRKLDDVKLQLDLLLDKLCIWQSVDKDEIFDFDMSPQRAGDADAQGRSGSKDRLQSFCVEVIVPFYMSRLPEQAVMINKKLGGPVHSSPPKRKAMKPPTTSRKSGEPKEPELKKSRRTLGRVATDTTGQNSQIRSVPSLQRSTTDSAILHGVKREKSEVPLAAIPFQRSPSAAARESMARFKHLSRRQIDLSAPSAAVEAKMKQKKRVEEELRAAISTLKKPNRGIAAGGYIDDIERRGLGHQNKSRKPLTTTRKILKDVQVQATPRAVKRTKDMIAETPSRHHNPFLRDELPSETLPSSAFCIPSSTVKPRSAVPVVPATVQRSVTARSLATHSIAETPTKAPNNKVFLAPGESRWSKLFATPEKARVSPPSTSINSTPPAAVTATPPALFATPTKVTKTIAESPLPAPLKMNSSVEEPSIYDALGWNDDDDLL